jgi:hypothetical protein
MAITLAAMRAMMHQTHAGAETRGVLDADAESPPWYERMGEPGEFAADRPATTVAQMAREQRAAMGWISVSDRLPTEETRVLVFSAERGIEVAFRWVSSHGGTYWEYREDSVAMIGSGVTHWAPLPPLPIK